MTETGALVRQRFCSMAWETETRVPSPFMSYEKKFASLLKMCHEAKENNAEAVVVAHPEVLGDNYEELVESLNRIADAELHLVIVPRKDRTAVAGTN